MNAGGRGIDDSHNTISMVTLISVLPRDMGMQKHRVLPYFPNALATKGIHGK